MSRNTYTPEFSPYSPNLSYLSGRVRYAANVLEEISTVYQAHDPKKFQWSAEQLRNEVPHIQQEEAEGTL